MQWHHYFIAIGVAVDLYEKFKGRKKTLALVRPKDMIERLEENISEQLAQRKKLRGKNKCFIFAVKKFYDYET